MATKTMNIGSGATTVDVNVNGNVVGNNIKSKGNSTTPVYFDANGVAQATQDISGKANKSGDTFSGNITIPTGSAYTIPNNTVIRPSSAAINASAMAGTMIWHDLFAFCKQSVPEYYTSGDGTTWVEATLDKTLFAQKGNNSKACLTSTVCGARWVWGVDNTRLAWGNAEWLVIGVTYQSPTAQYTVKFESSDDGETWMSRHESTCNHSTAPVYFKLTSYGGDRYLRLTITKATSDAGTLNIGQIRLLTARYGSQGMGIELEYPYQWNEASDIYPISNGTNSLGTTSYKWAKLYANAMNGTSISLVDSSGKTKIESKLGGDTGFFVSDSNSADYKMLFGIGSGHVNRGIYDNKLGKWLLHADASKMYLNNTEVPSNPKFTDTVLTQSDVSGWGFTKNMGTVTAVKVNGTSHSPTNGVVDLGTIETGAAGSLAVTTDENNNVHIAFVNKAEEASCISKTVKYSTSSSNTTIPSSGWTDTIPSAQGQYLWTCRETSLPDGNKYYDYSVSSQVGTHSIAYYKAVIPSNGAWQIIGNTYHITISVPGILDTDIPLIDIDRESIRLSTDRVAIKREWGDIVDAYTGIDEVHFEFEEIPENDIPVIFECKRGLN